MTVKEIPARTEITCDGCNQLLPLKDDMNEFIGRIIYKRSGFNIHGQPYESDYRFDFCRTCFDRVSDTVNNKVNEMMQENAGQENGDKQ